MTDLLIDSSNDTVAQVSMTLAAIAYGSGPAEIDCQLAEPKLATAGRFRLVWYGTDDANQMFVVRDVITGQQAVVIRGSTTDPHQLSFWLDWFGQDFSVFRMADWPYQGAPAGARVSHGSLIGLNSLLNRKDNGQTLVAFLRANRTPNVLTGVIGHSLGGTLSYLLAPYLHQEFSPGEQILDFWPVSFAAPTAGNGFYAGWLQSQFGGSVGRYHNDLDVAPQAWSDIEWIATSFTGGPVLPAIVRDALDGVRGVLKLLHDAYVQPGDGTRLTGSLVPAKDWAQEAGAQHAHATYLSLVGAPPLMPCPPASAQAVA